MRVQVCVSRKAALGVAPQEPPAKLSESWSLTKPEAHQLHQYGPQVPGICLSRAHLDFTWVLGWNSGPRGLLTEISPRPLECSSEHLSVPVIICYLHVCS